MPFGIDDRGHAVIWTDPKKFRIELIPPADVHRNDLVIKSRFLEKNCNYTPVRCRQSLRCGGLATWPRG